MHQLVIGASRGNGVGLQRVAKVVIADDEMRRINVDLRTYSIKPTRRRRRNNRSNTRKCLVNGHAGGPDLRRAAEVMLLPFENDWCRR